MKKITKKVTAAAPTETITVKKVVRKINLGPIIVLVVIVAAVYAYFRYGIVATVNGRPISRFSYWQNLEKVDKKQTIKQMANEALVFQAAAKDKIVIDKSVIEAEIASVEAQIKAQGQTLEGALAAEGLTRTDLEDQIRIQKMVEKMAKPNLEITQAQIDTFIQKNKALIPTTYTKEQIQALAKPNLLVKSKTKPLMLGLKNFKKPPKSKFANSY
jgi:foldase protein PrsA